MGQPLQLSPEAEPEIGSDGLYETVLGGVPSRQALFQSFDTGIGKAYETLSAFRTLGHGKQPQPLEFRECPRKCRRINE